MNRRLLSCYATLFSEAGSCVPKGLSWSDLASPSARMATFCTGIQFKVASSGGFLSIMRRRRVWLWGTLLRLRFNSSFTLYIFVFCLSLGIATTEVPELLSLRDDTANDVEHLQYLSNRVHQLSPRPAPRRFESLDGKFSPVEDVESFSLHHLATKCPTRAAQDVLHLLSIQRK